jgi:hypothetical protein
MIADVAEPTKIPSLAAESNAEGYARFEMKMDIVKPIPVRNAPAVRNTQSSPAPSAATRKRTANQLNSRTPSVRLTAPNDG